MYTEKFLQIIYKIIQNNTITTILTPTIQIFCLLFVPGLLVLFYLSKKIDDTLQKISLVFGTSLSYWIVGFSFLKFIKIPHNVFIYTSIIISIILFLIFLFIRKEINMTINWRTPLWILFISVTFFFFLRIYNNQIVATGADMATHTYTAKIIFNKNGYPNTHEPIVPISSFGFAPYGLSVLSATMSHISDIPIYRSSFLIAILSYIIFYLGLVTFLLNYYSHFTTFVTSFYIFFIEKNIITYLGWGGNTTILSMGIFIIMLNTIIRHSKIEDISYFTVSIVIALLAAGSFYTHQMSIIVFFYIIVILTIFFIWRYKLSRIDFKYILSFLIFLIFLLPFLTSYKKLTSIEHNHILHWQRNTERFSTITNALTLFTSPIENIMRWHSNALLILLIIGICISTCLQGRKKHSLFYFFGIIFLFIVLVNTNFWILPLSEIFYPDRILTLSLIPISYFIGTFFSVLENIIKLFIKRNIHSAYHLLLLCLPTYIVFSFFVVSYQIFFRDYVYWPTEEFTSVTINDMKVFDWIKNSLPKHSVIENNYGDSGIWIPSIAERKVKVNDSNAHYLSELYQAQEKLQAEYLFIGEKPVYRDGINFRMEDILKDPQYIKLYSSGNSAIFKKIRNNDY